MQPVARRRHGSFKKVATAAVATVTIASFGQGTEESPLFKLKTLRGPDYPAKPLPQLRISEEYDYSHELASPYGHVVMCGADTFRRDANTNHVISADVVVAQNSDVNQTSSSSSLRARPREDLTDNHKIPKRLKRIEARADKARAVENIRGWVGTALKELDIRITVESVDAENVYHKDSSKGTDTLVFVNLQACATVSCLVEDVDLLHVCREDVLRCVKKSKRELKCFGGDYYRREHSRPRKTRLGRDSVVTQVLRLKDPREGGIVRNLLRVFKEDDSGAPDSLDNVSPERKIPCISLVFDLVGAMSTATHAGYVLPEDVVHVGNVDAKKGICQLLGRQVEKVVEEWPKLERLLVGVEDIDLDKIDEEVLSKYLALAEKALTEASEAARQAFLYDSVDAASFDQGVPLHTDLIAVAAKKLAAGFTDCDSRILQKVMCILRMNYLLDLLPPEGEQVVCPVCHKVLRQEHAITHAMRLTPCRTKLFHNVLPKKRQFPCRGCPDINCMRGQFPFFSERQRDSHELRDRLSYVCKGASGGQDEGCGCSGCSATFPTLSALRRHISDPRRKVSDKDENGGYKSRFIGVTRELHRFIVQYRSRDGRKIHGEFSYGNEIDAAFEYNRCIIRDGLRDIRPLNPVFDGVPQAKIFCVNEDHQSPLYISVYRKMFTKGVNGLTPEEYAVALKYMLLPIEVYWPSDQKWHRGRNIEKMKGIRQYKVEYYDGGGTQWEALVEQYDGDGVPPCRGDEDHSYWRFAEASTSACACACGKNHRKVILPEGKQCCINLNCVCRRAGKTCNEHCFCVRRGCANGVGLGPLPAPEASTSARVVTDLAVGDTLRKFFEGFGWATGRLEIIEDGRVEVHWSEDDTYQWIPLTEALAHRVSRDAPDSDSEDEMPVSQLLARQAG